MGLSTGEKEVSMLNCPCLQITHHPDEEDKTSMCIYVCIYICVYIYIYMCMYVLMSIPVFASIRVTKEREGPWPYCRRDHEQVIQQVWLELPYP